MAREIVTIECTEARKEGKTPSRYTTTRNKKLKTEKLEIKKYNRYLRRHTVLEPWGTTNPMALLKPSSQPGACPDCGAPAGSDDAFCRSCGASLEPRVHARS